MLESAGRGDGTMSVDFEGMGTRLDGRSGGKTTKRVCTTVAGRSQRERGGSDDGKAAGVMRYSLR